MAKVIAQTLKIGDKIMPPAREIQLWMRRALAERNLPEAALQLTVTEVREGNPDKKGRWLIITGEQMPEWIGNGRLHSMRFKVRPETPWQTI